MIQKQSKLFTKTLREAPSGEEAANAIFLERGGFVYKTSAGVYSFLPLGWRVLEKIAAILREEMNVIGGQEIFMPALVDKEYWQATNRWDVGIGFEVKGKQEEKAGYALGWSHEDVLTVMASRYIHSYKDLPQYVYQIQTKFRNEPRPKSGLLRGREFLMKDLYSFHTSEDDLMEYYDSVAEAYKKIFERVGVKTYYTLAAGGEFTASNTHEFQAPSDVGEDTIFVCAECEYAENAEISKLEEGSDCPKCKDKIKQEKAIEVGNIFPLGTKYSEAVGLKYATKDGNQKYVVMGSYGVGLGRLMATVVEVSHDADGIIWPKPIAPFDVHVIEIKNQSSKVKAAAEEVCQTLTDEGLSVLYDDRDASAGEKFTDRDLIGIPHSVVISQKGLEDNTVEVFNRKDKSTKRIATGELVGYLSSS